MRQELTDTDIVKSILKKRKMTQEDLANLLKMGRTKLNLTLGVDWLPDEFKQRIIEVLELPPSTFPEKPKSLTKADLETVIGTMARQITQLLEQNSRILSLLEARA